jgi:aminoglycoside phosphotransferase (APT) family kinase protein
MAADLHGAAVDLGPPRTLDDEVHALRAAVAAVHRVSPALAARCGGWLRRIASLAEASTPMTLRLGHGDFTPSQAIFDETGVGLVDFDTMCQAEPALDLGQFLAYIRVVVATEGRVAAPPAAAAIAEPLCTRFLDTYVARSQIPVDVRQLRARVAVYELASLVRIALHSWYQFKAARVANVVAVLDDRTP